MVHKVIFGISGFKLTDQEKELFSSNQVLGFILFGRNIESQEQLKILVADLRNLYPEIHIPILIDQEGGRVARLKPPIVEKKFNSMEFFGNLYGSNKSTAIESTITNYTQIMQDLAKFGINSPCAPVADLRYHYADKVIGDRSFGSEVDKVVELCLTSIKAIEKEGGIAIIKHIPGHGRATLDSHHHLPRVSTSLEELNNSDFAVFKALSKESKDKWAMTAHIIFDSLDPVLPVTFSKKAIDFIRQEIGFQGTILSDDICMKALHEGINIEDHQQWIDSVTSAARQSLEAGCDIVLHCSGSIEEMQAVLQIV